MEKNLKLKNAFLEKAKSKYGDTFDYSKVDYKGSRTKVTIICPIHGEYEMTPEGHLKSKTGCPKCSHSLPKKAVVEGVKRKEMKEYSIWKAMKTRVSNERANTAEHYVLRGIKCCDSWFNSFENFYNDMGPCPGDGYSIDRIDPDGDYCPENCRWADSKTQSQNRGSFNKIFTYNGKTMVLKEWARELGIKYTTLYQRIYRSGLTFEEAIQIDPFHRLIEFKGEKHTLGEWCKIYNIEYEVVSNRINKHKWTFERAITTPKTKNV